MMSGVWWMGFDHRKLAPHPVVFRSIDGVTWAKTTAQPFADDVRAFCYLPGMVVAAGNNGNAARTTASTTSFEFASNTAFSNLTVGAPVTESGNGDDGKGNIVSLYPTSTPPYMQIAGITGTWDVGSRISAPPVQSATTTRLYCTLNGTGGVTNLQSADPGYTTVAGASPYHVTFPATLPSGDAPDADLPAGTTLTTEVQATNSAGTVTKASNTVTPA
jgi:hypothetical protein